VYRIGVKSEQVQLEDWAWAALQRAEAFRAWKAPWRERQDIGDSSEYVRDLREDDRLNRLNPTCLSTDYQSSGKLAAWRIKSANAEHIS
jgi:hypothetical protein